MDGIFNKIIEFIRDAMQGWVLTNLSSMFNDVNDKVGTIAADVAETPVTWNYSIYTMIRTLSNNVMMPIAGVVISYVLCYELITMVIDKNNMQEVDSFMLFKYLFKACIAVVLLSHTFEITMAIFDLGQDAVLEAGAQITGSTEINIGDALMDIFRNTITQYSIGALIGLAMETMIVNLCMKILSLLITVVIFGRMIEIYLTVSVAPIPFATMTNKEWGQIGANYIKSLLALAFQGFFIMVCVAIYARLVTNCAASGDLERSLWTVVAYTVVLAFSLFKTGNLSKAIFTAR